MCQRGVLKSKQEFMKLLNQFNFYSSAYYDETDETRANRYQDKMDEFFIILYGNPSTPP